MSLLLWGYCMGNDSILPECGGLSDYSDTKGNVFAALTDIENTEKIYLDNGVYKKNTALGSSWDLRIVHEGDQQVSGHGEGGISAGVPADLSVFIPYFKNLCERNGYPFIGTAQETQQR